MGDFAQGTVEVRESIADPRRDPRSALAALVLQWPDAGARILIVAVALILAWHTWGRWGDIQMDCGRELYVPSEILRGKLLYREISYYYGPLEPYLAAGLLRTFGRHLYVFYLFGLTLAIGSALTLGEIGATLESRTVGMIAGLALILQGFRPTMFNYIFPYSYAAMLGFFLSLLCAWLLVQHVLSQRWSALLLAGMAAGLAMLSKQEYGAASYVMLGFVVLAEGLRQRSVRRLMWGVVACLPGVLVCGVIYGWFFWHLGFHFILFDNWQFVPGSYFMSTYGSKMHVMLGGTQLNLLTLPGLAVDALAALFIWTAVGRLRVLISWRWFAGTLVLMCLSVVALRWAAPVAMYSLLVVMIFPVGMAAIGAGYCAAALHRLYSKGRQECLSLAELAFGLFALASAVRVFAQVFPYGYGIFYNGPLLLIFLISIRRCVSRANQGLLPGSAARAAEAALLAEALLLATALFPTSANRTVSFETGWGAIYLQPAQAKVAAQILQFVKDQKRQGRRVVLLPELPFIYAVTGTEAPGRWYSLMPGVVALSDESEYIRELARSNAEYIMLTNRYTREFGADYFGIDYDRRIYRWITANYRVAGQFGEFERNGNGFLAALIYQRRPGAAGRASD
ncbi:MAG TPA: hypothetical protein VFB33_14135 [Candidatus Binataceae bacterium]|nr:hypothetical protein [Candidatus Binataceae bacterium]